MCVLCMCVSVCVCVCVCEYLLQLGTFDHWLQPTPQKNVLLLLLKEDKCPFHAM